VWVLARKKYANLKELIKHELLKHEHSDTQNLIDKLKHVKKRGYFTKDEFLEMGRWKSPRPSRRYKSNSSKLIRNISEKVFATNYEKRKIELLTSLKGVGIPVASAILMLTDPKKYGVIDIRVWQLLYSYGSVSVKPTGTNFSFQNWNNYLMKLRYFAKEFNVGSRNIERTLFEYHKATQEETLYPRKKLAS